MAGDLPSDLRCRCYQPMSFVRLITPDEQNAGSEHHNPTDSTLRPGLPTTVECDDPQVWDPQMRKRYIKTKRRQGHT